MNRAFEHGRRLRTLDVSSERDVEVATGMQRVDGNPRPAKVVTRTLRIWESMTLVYGLPSCWVSALRENCVCDCSSEEV